MLNTAQNDSFQATPAGFWITHEQERREFRDQDVLGIRTETRRQSDMLGNLTLHQTLHVRVKDGRGERWIAMAAEVGPWDADPLAELRERLLDNLLERACDSLLKASDIEAPAWSLSLIHFRDRASGRSCAPQEITAIRWSGDQLQLFQENEAEPFAQYDRDAENTILLQRIFDQLLEGVCQDAEIDRPHGLGELQKQVTASDLHWLTPRRFAILAAVPVAAMIYALPISVAATGIVLLLLLFLVLMPLLTGTPATLRLYERAVVWTRGSEEVVLLLDHVVSLTAVHTSETQVDRSATPRLRLHLDSAKGDDRAIDFQTMITPENRELLEAIVIDASKVVAAGLRNKLDQDGQIPWSEQLAICDDALVCRPQPDGLPQRIPRADIQGWSLSDTKLTMVLPTGDAMSLSTACANFYPGLILLHERGWFKMSGR